MKIQKIDISPEKILVLLRANFVFIIIAGIFTYYLDYNENISETLNVKAYNMYMLEMEGEQISLDFGTAQEVFAKENGASIDPEDHPLEEEFEKYE